MKENCSLLISYVRRALACSCTVAPVLTAVGEDYHERSAKCSEYHNVNSGCDKFLRFIS